MSSTSAMKRLLMQAVTDGHLRLFDVQLSSRICEISESADPPLLLAVALCSYGIGRGDTCLSLTHCGEFQFFSSVCTQSRLDMAVEAGLNVDLDKRKIIPPEVDQWCAQLQRQSVVGVPGDVAPLILNERQRLYLGRYFELEQRLIKRLQHFASQQTGLPTQEESGQEVTRHELTGQQVTRQEMQLQEASGAQHLSESQHEPAKATRSSQTALSGLADSLKRIFKQSSQGEEGTEQSTDWQCVAAAHGALNRLSIITGGPGTGKTYTVAALLACLAEQYNENARPRIALAAPTGKAATRLTESIQKACQSLPITQDVKNYVLIEAQTLHRLLSIFPGQANPRFHAGRRLPYDMVIVDEASMVDLPLMTRTFDALQDDASIVLLGDKDQLASVESGMVLGDICGGRSATGFSLKVVNDLESVTGQTIPSLPNAAAISDHIVYLHHSYRSQDTGGISRLAASVNDGDADKALDYLASQQYPNLTLVDHSELAGILSDVVHPVYATMNESVYTEEDIDSALQALTSVSVLCALRKGRYGAVGINERLRKLLSPNGRANEAGDHYVGQPIMIRENSLSLRLFNGDTGLVFSVDNYADTDDVDNIHIDGNHADRAYADRSHENRSHENRHLANRRLANRNEAPLYRAFFGDSVNKRSFATARLPEHETAYAMTIHKSQGSEFETVVVILPEDESPLLTRELLYTAITRAKRKVIIVANEPVLRVCIGRRAVRQSGLRDEFWDDSSVVDSAAADDRPRTAAKARQPQTKPQSQSAPVQASFDF